MLKSCLMVIRRMQVFCFVIGAVIVSIGCESIDSPDKYRKQADPTPPTNSEPTITPERTNTNVNGTNKSENTDMGEITSCYPEQLFRGDVLTIKLKVPHGRYSAILRKKDQRWFFLYGGGKNNPNWDDPSFTMTDEIAINTETALNATNVDLDAPPEKIFDKTGVYRIMVSHEDFGQDDPPWTGMCEISYSHESKK